MNSEVEREAEHYKSVNEDELICELCPHSCRLASGDKGICRVRENQSGRLYSLNYGQVTSAAMDPIEKKPLYHFQPGTSTLSLGTWGCNLTCSFCQNWRISQGNPTARNYSPAGIVELALDKNSSTISFTYSEPIVWYEFIEDTAPLADEHDLDLILVTNGFINRSPLKKLIPHISACNVDLKAMNADFYRQNCGGGDPEHVRRTIEELFSAGIHVEVTYLLIPGENDDREELIELCEFLQELNPGIPLHISRYFPRHQFKRQKTPDETLKGSYELASSMLDHVYLGNIDLPDVRTTFCPDCGAEVIDRSYYNLKNKLQAGNCPDCGAEIYGVF
ncbi:AmmeMemoRadiSam system radical SAM enzyme [Halarsenatibacter silvermanii]|uniref:Pyruvate formate lyase activating enzyme n=1 Tax=Halarsenatibacter silvermanii TaxID=321763 RepID=A0A1G9NF24_9FIRM|nr:AmmeMemoRadiSam system radical SAM enzyme [Halarsenatibacter silvermanii]SDL84535.1 pyruvate formate lyase activating enzyme [Halarsenatibacter silvermanii]